MKLVMSAMAPLNLDQIRVALCVDIGELVWHPEKIAKDGTQLVSLSGGNLLDLDEEDGKVRFIHHSVIQHLLAPADSPSTTPYHFTAEDAENYVGAMCVTYLHLPVMDSRITVTRNLQSMKVLENVVGTTQQSLPVASRLIEHIKSRERKRGRPSQINVGQIFAQIQAARIQQDLDPRCLADYATKHWVIHTRFFDAANQDCKKSWKIWWRLLYGGVATVKQPCPNLDGDSFPVLMWAVERGHGSLFRIVISETTQTSSQLVELIQMLALHKSIHGQWLGDILAQYLVSLRSIEVPSTASNIKALLDLEADPCTPHHIFNSEPLRSLAHWICLSSLSGDAERELINVVFSHPTVLKALDDRSVLEILRELNEGEKNEAVVTILALHPDLEFGFQRRMAKRRFKSYRLTVHDTKPLIEKALENEDWEYVEAFGKDQVNYPTSSGTSLLWKAIETMSDAWVYHFLKLGADPNVGPFTMRQHPDGSMPTVKCYPLEAALWLRRTRVCLELLRSGALTDGLGHSLVLIARETENSILIAKLYEELAPSKRHKSLSHWKPYEHGRTALSTACAMLSYSGIGEHPPGFPKPLHTADETWNWESELEKIIYRLALDGEPGYVNAQDMQGRTALHHLAAAKDMDADRLHTVFNVLLSRGANPNLRDVYHKTPSQIADFDCTESSPM